MSPKEKVAYFLESRPLWMTGARQFTESDLVMMLDLLQHLTDRGDTQPARALVKMSPPPSVAARMEPAGLLPAHETDEIPVMGMSLVPDINGFQVMWVEDK